MEAGSFSTALVSAMADDAWQGARSRIVAVLRRCRPEAATPVSQTLAEQRTRLLEIPSASRFQAEDELHRHWQTYFLDLVQADPVAAHALSDALVTADRQQVKNIHQVGNAHESGRVYIAGSDQISTALSDHQT
ncbi:hypothetical protein [Streptomyces naphthomycinicus]|uniref:hypothetical protein n=1 Tax=Streptomyces naphthomycinicus TaxID=2872625 RepID=UPI001CED8ACC|nr:hypothetical protein [Streptomyces sp. TML10]